MSESKKKSIQEEIEDVDRELQQLNKKKERIKEGIVVLKKEGPKPVPKWMHHLMEGSIVLFVISILSSGVVALLDQLSNSIFASLPVHPLTGILTTFGLMTCSTILTIKTLSKRDKQHQQTICDKYYEIQTIDSQLMEQQRHRNNLETQKNQTKASHIDPIKTYPSEQATNSNGFRKQKKK